MSNFIYGLKVGLFIIISIVTICLTAEIIINMLLRMYSVGINYLIQYLTM